VTVRLKLDSKAIQLLSKIPGLKDSSDRAGERVVAEIRATAPVNEGEYRDSWSVVDDAETDGGVMVETTSFKYAWIEFGTVKQPALRIAEDAARSVGLEFEAK